MVRGGCATLQRHTAPVCSITAFGEKVSSGDWEGKALVWHAESGDVLHSLTLNHAFAGASSSASPFFVRRPSSGSLLSIHCEALSPFLLSSFSVSVKKLFVCAVTVCALPPLLLSGSQTGKLNVWHQDGSLKKCISSAPESLDGFLSKADCGLL